MLHGLVDTIADIWSAPDRWIEAELAAADAAAAQLASLKPPSPEPEDQRFRAHFLELARTRQRQNGRVVCGLLRLIRPGSRLMAVGAARADTPALTAMVADSVLGQMAAPPDCFTYRDPDTYLVCFASGNVAVAGLRATMMGQALRAALVRTSMEPVSTLRVESVVADLDPVDIVLNCPNIAAGLVERLDDSLSQQVAGTVSLAPRAA